MRAKLKAARRIVRGWLKPSDLPSNAEIREQVLAMARLHEGERQADRLMEMRICALRWMRILQRFRPRLIGSVLTGHVHHASDIDLHLFSDSIEAIVLVLENEMVHHEVERKSVKKMGEHRVFTHIHIRDEFPVELTIYPSDKAHFVFKSSITGKAMERASLAEFEQLLQQIYPERDIDAAVQEASDTPDRFQVYESLLLPLENVKQHAKYHPEGDVLYHSLQVFDLAKQELPYDEEFLLAALLHDVGKGIDPTDHVAAGVDALDGFITDRTKWLIEHHMEAQRVLDGTIGSRARKRLSANESFEELILLAECDRDGRVPGVQVPDLDECLEYLRELGLNFYGTDL